MNERERCPPRNGVICTQFFFDRHVHLEDYSFITTPAFVTSLLLNGISKQDQSCRSRLLVKKKIECICFSGKYINDLYPHWAEENIFMKIKICVFVTPPGADLSSRNDFMLAFPPAFIFASSLSFHLSIVTLRTKDRWTPRLLKSKPAMMIQQQSDTSDVIYFRLKMLLEIRIQLFLTNTMYVLTNVWIKSLKI